MATPAGAGSAAAHRVAVSKEGRRRLPEIPRTVMGEVVPVVPPRSTPGRSPALQVLSEQV
jgi:hypothetical protein